METIFISDLHLSPSRPGLLADFKALLDQAARRGQILYILGDLFEEFWVGIDDPTPPAPEVIGWMREFTGGGGRMYVLRGNRELMLDDGFGRLTGCTVLPDHSVIEINGDKVLIMHGDLLCTRDTGYQLFRRTLVNPAVKNCFAALPLSLRLKLVHGLKDPIRRKMMAKKAPDIMDADQAAVEQAMRSAGVCELIHGHTHRPGIHDFDLGGRAARRIVLGDWYEGGRMLVCRDGGRSLVPVSDFLRQA